MHAGESAVQVHRLLCVDWNSGDLDPFAIWTPGTSRRLATALLIPCSHEVNGYVGHPEDCRGRWKISSLETFKQRPDEHLLEMI